MGTCITDHGDLGHGTGALCETAEDAIEQAIRQLERVWDGLPADDPRAAPTGWLIDRLTEMNVYGPDYGPTYHLQVDR